MFLKEQNLRKVAAFTLIELLVAIAILGILGTIVINEVWNHVDQAEVVSTKTKLKQLDSIVAAYKRAHHRLPSDLQDLLAKDPKHFNKAWATQEQLLDAWEEPLQLRSEGLDFWIISLGADFIENGFDEELGIDADLSSKAIVDQF